jgi:hypothetical protein
VTGQPCQRWRDRRGTYRPAGEPIRTADYEVAPIATDREARAFVVQHHYSASFPAARARFGLYRRGELAGVAVLSHPASEAALSAALPVPCDRLAKAELGRLVLLDSVPANGESWFMARAFELARRDGFEAIVSHSDPEPRRTAAGGLVFPGHVGCVYQALNATYCGKTPARTWRLLPDGSVLSNRAFGKLRDRERGWRYVLEMVLAHGASAPEGDWLTWVARARATVTRAFRHRGNHRYVWALNKRLTRHLPEGQAYPKLLEAA